MRNATRNRIVMSVMLLIFTAAVGMFVWIMIQVSEGLDRAAVGAGLLVLLWVGVVGSTVRQAREIRRLERSLEAEGIVLPDEPPIPIKLAKDRQSLVASAIALALIGLTFVAYHKGWLAELGLTAARPD